MDKKKVRNFHAKMRNFHAKEALLYLFSNTKFFHLIS